MAPDAASSDVERALAAHAADAFIVADRGGVIRSWNRGAEILFGVAARDALGLTLDLIIPERFRAAHDAGYRRAMETGALKLEGRVLTTRSQHASGQRLYVDLSFGLMRDPGGAVTGAFAIGRDATERHMAGRARASGAP